MYVDIFPNLLCDKTYYQIFQYKGHNRQILCNQLRYISVYLTPCEFHFSCRIQFIQLR